MATCTGMSSIVVVVLVLASVPSEGSWKDRHNGGIDNGLRYMKSMYNTRISTDPKDKIPIKEDIEIPDNIPDSFDAREHWPHCPSVSSVKDQGFCGSAWALAPTSMVSDRLCIATHGKVKVNISVENVMACCSECYYITECMGGYTEKALIYIQTTGAVTGGDFLSNEGCQPYEIGHRNFTNRAPTCHKSCTNKQYAVPYNKDLHFDKTTYQLQPGNEKAIQADIMKNGPVIADFLVPVDFEYYKSGVYNCNDKLRLGHHVVRIIGWGTEDGQKYWLAANSRGWTWGDKGYFKMLRGENSCYFEDYVYGVIVKQ